MAEKSGAAKVSSGGQRLNMEAPTGIIKKLVNIPRSVVPDPCACSPGFPAMGQLRTPFPAYQRRCHAPRVFFFRDARFSRAVDLLRGQLACLCSSTSLHRNSSSLTTCSNVSAPHGAPRHCPHHPFCFGSTIKTYRQAMPQGEQKPILTRIQVFEPRLGTNFH